MDRVQPCTCLQFYEHSPFDHHVRAIVPNHSVSELHLEWNFPLTRNPRLSQLHGERIGIDFFQESSSQIIMHREGRANDLPSQLLLWENPALWRQFPFLLSSNFISSLISVDLCSSVDSFPTTWGAEARVNAFCRRHALRDGVHNFPAPVHAVSSGKILWVAGLVLGVDYNGPVLAQLNSTHGAQDLRHGLLPHG